MIRSLLQSSRLELLTSKGAMTLLYAVGAVAIWVWWATATWQFVQAYQTLHAFDVTPTEFLQTTVFLFVPLLLLGAYMTRLLIQRLRLRAWFRQQTTVPAYAAQQAPAIAGYLSDYTFSDREIYATLLDLHQRGAISLLLSAGQSMAVLNNVQQLSAYERALLDELFGGSSQVALHGLGFEQHLREAGLAAHGVLVAELQRAGALPAGSLRVHGAIRGLVRLVLGFGCLMGGAVAYIQVAYYEEVSQVLYPRYDVQIWQLLLLAATWLLLVGSAWSGRWPRFSTDRHDAITQGWLQAAGFRAFLATVYRSRLSPAHLASQDVATVRKLAPFMITYGLAPADLAYIQQVIQHTRLPVPERSR